MKERFVFLDGLRGVAAVAVVIFHFTQHTPHPLMKNAYFAVDLFFVLSGFVIAKAYRRRISAGMPFRVFTSLRVKRLYPMFAVGLILGACALVAKIHFGQANFSAFEVALSLIVNALYLPFFSSNAMTIGADDIIGASFPANNPSWTLFFEFYVNLAFFALWRSSFYTTRRLGVLWSISLIIFVAAIGLGWGSSGWGTSVVHMSVGVDRAIYGFSAGVLIASLPKLIVPARYQVILGIIIAIFFLAVCCLPGSKISFLSAVLVSPVLVWLGSSITMGAKANIIGEWLGELSYPLYCVHFPVLMAADAFGVIGPGYASSLLMVAFCVVVAAVLARYLDGPVRAMLRDKRQQVSPV